MFWNFWKTDDKFNIDELFERRKYAEIKALFQKMDKDPKIRAVYKILRQPQVRNNFTYAVINDATKCVCRISAVQTPISICKADSDKESRAIVNLCLQYNRREILYHIDVDYKNPAHQLLRYRMEMIQKKVEAKRQQAKEEQEKEALERFCNCSEEIRKNLIEYEKQKSTIAECVISTRVAENDIF